MSRVIESVCWRRFAPALLIGAMGLAAAGCSSEVTRFSQPLFGGSSQTQYTGTVTPSPAAGIERRDLDAPGGGPAENDRRTVTAERGDTAYSIARRHGVPHTALMEANGLSDPMSVRPGQRLVIPNLDAGETRQARQDWQPPQVAPPPDTEQATAPPQAEPQRPTAATQSGATHRVAHGETVYSIARAYSVGPNEIIRANGIDSPNRIRVGQSLTIPGASGQASQTSAQSEQRDTSQTAQTGGREETRTAQAEQVEPVPASFTTGGEDSRGEADTRAGVADPAPLSAGNFRWPARGRVISGFGDTSSGSRNDGVNIAVPEGTSVRASENGVVAYAGDELKGYGNLVLIRHSDDWVTAYAHNSEIMVRRGDEVSRGQVIAKAGQTGSVNSPQLHFELRKGSQPVDPLRYLAEN